MLVREAIEARIGKGDASDADDLKVRLRRGGKSDAAGVRIGLLQRLACSRQFTLGDRSGVLGAAQRRSGRAFRLDVRQRVIVKALVSRHLGQGFERGAALARHLVYLGRAGAGMEGARPVFFDRASDEVSPTEGAADWSAHRHHFRFIVSPEHGDRIADLRDYTREVMTRVCDDLGEPDLPWMAVCHFDTDQPHAHVLLPGRRASGRDLVIPRDYVAYGFRARAQEVAQERLGDLSRHDAERRIWRETRSDGFTGFDRRLLASMDAERMVDDAEGLRTAWAALTRGRLIHLEALGLAERRGRRYRLDKDLEGRLRRLQISRDVIRTLNQRRLETGLKAEAFREGRVAGRVMKTGCHDELGAAPFVILRDVDGVEHYARLSVGTALPRAGSRASLTMGARGLALLSPGAARGGPDQSL